MQDTISETLIESLYASIVNAAEKEGVQSHELFALLHDRFHPTQRQEMPRKKRLKTKHDGTLPEHKWWNKFPSELTNSVLDCLPRCELANFSQCSKELNKVVEDYAKAHLEKTDLGKSLIKRHMDGTSRERRTFSPAYLLLCTDAAPKIGSYFEQKGFRERRIDFDAMVRNMYPNDLYQEKSYVGCGRVMFVIDGIVVYQALESDSVRQTRFRVCRCPLPTLLWSMKPWSVEVWISGVVQVPWIQVNMEACWRQGWSMYDHDDDDDSSVNDDDSSVDDDVSSDDDDDSGEDDDSSSS